MSGLPSQHSYQNPDSNKLDQIDSTEKKNLFNSVTDSEEFYNPFSDLNLFLANKIK